MRIRDMSWHQVEGYLKRDDRAVLPLGSTEQHAGLSLSVDSILAEKVALDAAEPLGIPVFPPVNYGLTPYFLAYPGTVSLRVETYVRLIREILDSLAGHGFRRILIVNGHGGNQPVAALAGDLMVDFPRLSIKFHNWWSAPKAWAKVQAIDTSGSHANWMENFPWTRLADVAVPKEAKSGFDRDLMRASAPAGVREILGDGAFGGDYQKPDDMMLDLWRTGVEETRALLVGPWPA